MKLYGTDVEDNRSSNHFYCDDRMQQDASRVWRSRITKDTEVSYF